jgi:hypothetical protein
VPVIMQKNLKPSVATKRRNVITVFFEKYVLVSAKKQDSFIKLACFSAFLLKLKS